MREKTYLKLEQNQKEISSRYNIENLKISKKVLIEIKKLGYRRLTSIQKICIPPSLKGFDVLGSAKTGSGKSLCFAVPIIEKIYLSKWCKSDSILSCILCPVRELGIQLFNFFKNFSLLSSLKIGLFLGGKNKKKKNIFEKNFSLVISTPGRLFQIILEKIFLNFDYLKILVLDEVDRILDLGFRKFFFLILNQFSKKKQILIFSATLTTKLRNLARLNLKNPFFGCVQLKKFKNNKMIKKGFPGVSTRIFQYYCVLRPETKPDILFSFLKSHYHRKIIVFFSTRKQVKFFYILFKKLKINLNFFYTYGDMNQNKRISNFIGFYKAKKGVLFSTDIMSRGIDFKYIDWVIQMDCPQNVETYVHRIGRTGRFFEKGKTLLFLNYNETQFLNYLRKNQININLIHFDSKQILTIKKKTQKLIKKNKFLNNLARNAFFNYIRFIFFQKNKNIFNLEKILWYKIAMEFGLEDVLLKKNWIF